MIHFWAYAGLSCHKQPWLVQGRSHHRRHRHLRRPRLQSPTRRCFEGCRGMPLEARQFGWPETSKKLYRIHVPIMWKDLKESCQSNLAAHRTSTRAIRQQCFPTAVNCQLEGCEAVWCSGQVWRAVFIDAELARCERCRRCFLIVQVFSPRTCAGARMSFHVQGILQCPYAAFVSAKLSYTSCLFALAARCNCNFAVFHLQVKISPTANCNH